MAIKVSRKLYGLALCLAGLSLAGACVIIVHYLDNPDRLTLDIIFLAVAVGLAIFLIARYTMPSESCFGLRCLIHATALMLHVPILIAIYKISMDYNNYSVFNVVLNVLGYIFIGGIKYGAKGVFITVTVTIIPPSIIITIINDLSTVLRISRVNGQATRRRAKSDLFGDSDFMSKADMGRLSQHSSGIILGQYKRFGRWRNLIYPLTGSMLTYAPPRMGKTATKILNYLLPDGRGHQGPIVDIDPRGEAFCVTARRRSDLGRDIALIDPFNLIGRHRDQWGDRLDIPRIKPACFNPLDLIRDGEEMVGDIDALLDALLEPPLNEAGNAMHFHKSLRNMLRGVIAWVRFREPDLANRTIHRVYTILLSSPDELKAFTKTKLLRERNDLCGLPFRAGSLLERVPEGEGGSNFSTAINALDWLNYPQIQKTMAKSNIDPMRLCEGTLDVFVVIPEDNLKNVQAFLRMWSLIPHIVTSRRMPVEPVLVTVDEMAALGRIDRLVDTFNMAAGKGLHYWTITQTESSFDRTYGATTRKVISDLAEVIQILGVPRENKAFAEKISAAIGFATFEQTSVSSSNDPRSANSNEIIPVAHKRDSRQVSFVKGAVMMPEDIMQLSHDEQIVLASPRATTKKHALRLHKINYWEHPATRDLASPNPYALRLKPTF